MEWVAHRAGNRPQLIAPALRAADGVELDVHVLRGRLEVRHSKTVWPLRIYWESGLGFLPDERPEDLATIVAAAPQDAALWCDLKGFSPRLTNRVLGATRGRRGLTMSSRSWWILRAARRTGDVRTFRSVGSRLQLWIALRIRHPDGVAMAERFATDDVVRRMSERCAAIAVWGAKDRERVEELRAGGIGVLIVDDLGLVDGGGECATS